MNRFDLVVIGGGRAGVTAALPGAELGGRVALVEGGLPPRQSQPERRVA